MQSPPKSRLLRVIDYLIDTSIVGRHRYPFEATRFRLSLEGS